jgi:hypothetical protein
MGMTWCVLASCSSSYLQRSWTGHVVVSISDSRVVSDRTLSSFNEFRKDPRNQVGSMQGKETMAQTFDNLIGAKTGDRVGDILTLNDIIRPLVTGNVRTAWLIYHCLLVALFP